MTGSRILVVDDEEFVVEELAEALSEEGYDVVQATKPDAVLALPDLAAIDVILTDLKMPGITGLDLFAALRARGLPAEGILLSGHGAQAERDAAYAAGFFACLSKPVDIDDLLEAVEAACIAGKEKKR